MKESSTAVARLRRRMTAYRGRSQEQEIRQQERDKVQQQETTVGFNLFCLEFAKKIVSLLEMRSHGNATLPCRTPSRSRTLPG